MTFWHHWYWLTDCLPLFLCLLLLSLQFDSFPTELDDDEHTLAYYGVSDGATIFMNEIDVEEIKRQQEKAKQQQQSQLEKQEALEMKKQKHKQQLLQQS